MFVLQRSGKDVVASLSEQEEAGLLARGGGEERMHSVLVTPLDRRLPKVTEICGSWGRAGS